MRVLFTMQPAIGHFHSMVPLAQALVDQGHEVAFATSANFGPYVQRAGFEHLVCGLTCAKTNDILSELPGWPDRWAHISHPGIRQIWGFIQGFGPRMADDLIALVPDWKPDLIVRDPVEFGGYVAAEYFDIPHASILWAMYISPRDGCTDALNTLRQRHGLPAEPGLESFDRYFVLNMLPPSWPLLSGAAPPSVVHRFCMPPFDRSIRQDLPDWVHTLPDRPTVYATLGTTFNQSPERFRALIAALGAEDFNTIITVGQTVDPAQFHPLPPAVKVEQYIPQMQLFPYCDAVVFHGGFNTLHAVLWHGLPMVVMPMGAGDQLPTGQQCAELGLGLLVEGVAPEPDSIRAAIRSVLDRPTYRQRAQQFQREMMDLPTLADAVRRLDVLAATRAPQLGQ